MSACKIACEVKNEDEKSIVLKVFQNRLKMKIYNVYIIIINLMNFINKKASEMGLEPTTLRLEV